MQSLNEEAKRCNDYRDRCQFYCLCMFTSNVLNIISKIMVSF